MQMCKILNRNTFICILILNLSETGLNAHCILCRPNISRVAWPFKSPKYSDLGKIVINTLLSLQVPNKNWFFKEIIFLYVYEATFSHLLSALVYIFKYFFYSFLTPVFTTYQNNFFYFKRCHKFLTRSVLFSSYNSSPMGQILWPLSGCI
jgi:hypothetical protein